VQEYEQPYQVQLADVGYWREQIKCQHACPVHTDARGYVRAIAEGDYRRAYLIARGPNPFASICGRICGAPCEAACRRGDLDQPIAIRALKRVATERHGPEQLLGELGPKQYRAEYMDQAGSSVCDALDEIKHLLQIVQAPSWRKPDVGPVAIIGAGPAGLSCAHDLALLGVRSVVFEIEPTPAGMLYYGVPAYRLPRDLIAAEVKLIEAMGVEVRCSTEIGKDVAFDTLMNDFAAVVIAVGAKRSRALDLDGVHGPGVLGGVDFLRDVALGAPPSLGERVVVIGGGNVAYDVARTSLRQSYFDAARTAARLRDVAKVHLACLESRDEMPADDIEVHEGDEEGIERHHRLGPVRVVRDAQGQVTGVEFKRVLRVFDEQHRFSPQFDEDDRVVLEADTVILAVGQAADLSFVSSDADVDINERGILKLDASSLATTNPKVFAAGDIAHGTRLMIDAIASGKKAARSVYHFLTGEQLEASVVQMHVPLERYRREKDFEKRSREPIPSASVAERLKHPEALVEKGYGPDAARCEAGRCFDCGVNTIFDGEKCVLCGGCVDVCPTLCLKLVPADSLAGIEGMNELAEACLGEGCDLGQHSAIIKDETVCIRCANCAMRCPTGAITMERFSFGEAWR
jgi:formate dehydrogenase (NADP+) beta subunit